MNIQIIFFSYLIINLFSYALMWKDKRASIKKKARISENTFFILAFLFGALGMYCAMKAPIYHKSSKTKFKIGIPILICLNLFFVFYIIKKSCIHCSFF